MRNEQINQPFSHSIIPSFVASLAQLVEQLIRNEQVAGSIPAVGSEMGKDFFVRAGKTGRHEMGFPISKNRRFY